MLPGNCGEENTSQYPSNWDETRRKNFHDRVSVFKVLPEEHIPVVAQALENMGAVEQDLIDYLIVVKSAQDNLVRITEKLRGRVKFSTDIMNKFSANNSDKIFYAIVKLLALLTVALPLFLLNLPARVIYEWKYKRILNNMPPNLMEYVKVKKHLEVKCCCH